MDTHLRLEICSVQQTMRGRFTPAADRKPLRELISGMSPSLVGFCSIAAEVIRDERQKAKSKMKYYSLT